MLRFLPWKPVNLDCYLWRIIGLEFSGLSAGAGRRIRTPDLLITNQPLYLLSYAGAARFVKAA